MGEALVDRGALDEKSFQLMSASLERDAFEARTVHELFGIYRRAIHDIVAAAEKPGAARHDRSLRRAEEHMRRHYAEPLTLGGVARVAGFAPNYFSTLFRKKQGITFERYLLQLRVARAKQLLSTESTLGLSRVAQLSGFSDAHYFGRAFKTLVGETPGAFQRRVGLAYGKTRVRKIRPRHS
jgi:YesN/AraC family two-component response regulator